MCVTAPYGNCISCSVTGPEVKGFEVRDTSFSTECHLQLAGTESSQDDVWIVLLPSSSSYKMV